MSEIETVEEKSPLKGVAKLEEEGDIAADYLEALLDIADLDGDIDIDVENVVTFFCDEGEKYINDYWLKK